jgi:hypothetical protein
MIVKGRTTDIILYAILVWCILSFKVVLIGVGESGIRADDFLILIALVLLLARGDLGRVKRSRSFNIYLGFVAANIVSTVWNSAAGRISPSLSVFFVIRLPQYMVFYYLGHWVARNSINLSRVLSIYLGMLCVAVPLQMLGLLPVTGAFGGITTRAVGNTNGPYELAAVGAFLLCYLGYWQKKRIGGLFSVGLILLSASRVTSLATAFSAIKVGLRRVRSRRQRVIGIASIAALVIAGIVVVRSTSGSSAKEQVGIVGRLNSAASGTSINTLTEAYNDAPVYATSTDYLAGEFLTAFYQGISGEGDASGMMRVFRWATLIKSTLGRYDSVLVGLGPSFGSAAVDGYFVRVFVETGLLGLVLFLWFVQSLMKDHAQSSWPFREYMIIMLCTATFIDIFVSYKPMLFLWLWHGMQQAWSREGTNEGRLLHES